MKFQLLLALRNIFRQKARSAATLIAIAACHSRSGNWRARVPIGAGAAPPHSACTMLKAASKAPSRVGCRLSLEYSGKRMPSSMAIRQAPAAGNTQPPARSAALA